MTFPRIVFFGTPEFAVCSLQKILDSCFPVVAVVTAPDRPAGRGLNLKPSAVKAFSDSRGIPVLQPLNLKDPLFLEELQSFKADLQIVIAFRMLPEKVWSLPPLGTFNLHASLLPQYRGAAPINHAIMNGEKNTGITTFMLNERIDEGRILLSEKVNIGDEETAGELHDRLMTAGADLVLKTIEGIILHKFSDISQEFVLPVNNFLKPAPKLQKEDCRIDWNRDITDIYNQIRGLSPYPGAFSEVKAKNGSSYFIKIFRGLPVYTLPEAPAGSLLSDGKSFLKIAGKNGYIQVLELQLPGKKTMNIAAFLRGAGQRFI